MGFDHAQWEMYSGSKHGVRYALKQAGSIPETAAAPTCQTCHMTEGNHAVDTPWGFLAVRLPLPEDPQWAADQTTILQALGILDPKGEVTARFDGVKKAKMAKLTHEEWQVGRDRMIGVCIQCHSINFATSELDKGDDIIRTADHLMAEAIRIVAGLYEDGILEKPEGYAMPSQTSSRSRMRPPSSSRPSGSCSSNTGCARSKGRSMPVRTTRSGTDTVRWSEI